MDHTATPRLAAIGWCFAACLLAAPLALQAQTLERFTVSIQQQTAGTLVKTTDAQGRVSVDFSYRDNGRGPDIKEEFSVDGIGALVS